MKGFLFVLWAALSTSLRFIVQGLLFFIDFLLLLVSFGKLQLHLGSRFTKWVFRKGGE